MLQKRINVLCKGAYFCDPLHDAISSVILLVITGFPMVKILNRMVSNTDNLASNYLQPAGIVESICSEANMDNHCYELRGHGGSNVFNYEKGFMVFGERGDDIYQLIFTSSKKNVLGSI